LYHKDASAVTDLDETDGRQILNRFSRGDKARTDLLGEIPGRGQLATGFDFTLHD
jgi:hypothetical protein